MIKLRFIFTAQYQNIMPKPFLIVCLLVSMLVSSCMPPGITTRSPEVSGRVIDAVSHELRVGQ